MFTPGLCASVRTHPLDQLRRHSGKTVDVVGKGWEAMTMRNMQPHTLAQGRSAASRDRKRSRAGSLLRRLLLGLLVVILVLAGMAAGAGYLFVQRTLPQTNGTVKVAGLEAAVSV